MKHKNPPAKEEIVQFYREMLELLESAYNNKIMDDQEYNVILEAIREAEQRIFRNYTEIKQEVDNMVSSTLELKSLKMRDEAVKRAARQTTLDNIERMKKFGFHISEEQKQELLRHAMDQQKTLLTNDSNPLYTD